MRLECWTVYAASVPDTIAFYEAAFELERGMAPPTGEYGEPNTVATKLPLSAIDFAAATPTAIYIASAGPDHPAPPPELGLVTDGVKAACERARAAGTVAATPRASLGVSSSPMSATATASWSNSVRRWRNRTMEPKQADFDEVILAASGDVSAREMCKFLPRDPADILGRRRAVVGPDPRIGRRLCTTRAQAARHKAK